MSMAAPQKAAAQAIVNIFETGSIRGNYGDVTLMRGDSGQLTYGRSQTTLASGNLYLLINDYAARADGALSAQFKPYLPLLEACDPSLNTNATFRRLLKDAGDDPVMQEVQDTFFDRVYWDPAMRSAAAIGAQTPLGCGIVYDSTVHGSWPHVRDLTRKHAGELADLGEKKWMAAYVKERRNWLATYPNPLLHKTVYRMDAFQTIIDAGNWNLDLPLAVRGFSITPAALGETTPVKVSADGAPRRILRLKDPPMTGADVAWLQERLVRAGFRAGEDSVFDSETDAAVRAFQQSNDLSSDGVVGPVTRSALEDISVITPAPSVTLDLPMPAVAPVQAAFQSQLPSLDDDTTASAPTPSVSDMHTHASPDHAPAPASADAVAQIKSHVTHEVQVAVARIQHSQQQQHDDLWNAVVGALQGNSGTLVSNLEGQAIADGRAFVSKALASRPTWAAALSVLLLVFTEGRDALVWGEHLPKMGQPAPSLPNIQWPQTSADWSHLGTQAYAYIHGLAQALPAGWQTGLRGAAAALIAYLLVRLRQRRSAEKKIAAA